MKIWLPYVVAGSGTDVFTRSFATALQDRGIDAIATPFAHRLQYAPWLLKRHPAPPGTDIIVTNSWNGFAFKRTGPKLVAIEHLFVLDPAFRPYRSLRQAVFHETLIRRFELATFRSADAVVAVSRYVAKRLHDTLGVRQTYVIYNGIDTNVFRPNTERQTPSQRPVQLLFVGNLTRRKGADLLAPLMQRLGQDYRLRYTSGLRTTDALSGVQNATPLGRLDRAEIVDAYQTSDLLVFRTRLEGFGYSAAEAMACGIPVVATRCSSLPELIEDGDTGFLWAADDVDAFESAIRTLSDDGDLANRMALSAREVVTSRFSLGHMIDNYIALFKQLLSDRAHHFNAA